MTPDERDPIDPPDESAEAEAKVVADDLEALRAKAGERDEYLDRLQRTMADFQNYKNRVGREKADLRRFITAEVVRAILPVLDNLERAVGAASNDSGALLQGVGLTIGEMHRILEGLDVKPVETKNARFDPSFMEAVARVETDDAAENTVIDVYEKGYRLGDLVVRPARVSVAAAKKAESGSD